MTIQERNQATKGMLILRVSDKDQEEGYSLDAQNHSLKEYCLRKGIEIIKIFEFSESSTVGKRKEFKEAIEFAKS